MSLTLIATAGAANANSYATAAEGDTYHERHLYDSDWTGATTANKEAALVWATQVIDENLEFSGAKASIDQALRWPRYGVQDRDGIFYDSDVIPQFLKNAAAEFARLLIASDRTAEPDTQGFKSITVGPISLDIDKYNQLSVIPESVYAMLRHVASRVAGSARKLIRV